MQRLLVVGLTAAIALIMSALARAATITVDTVSDRSSSGDRRCSLREAINNTNAKSDTSSGDCHAGTGVDTIKFSVSGGIVLGSQLPIIRHTLAIDGKGRKIAVDAAGSSGVMAIHSHATLTLRRMTLDRGNSVDGGGVDNHGSLTVIRCTFSRNNANFGGGIFNVGILTVVESAFYSNRSIQGGGIYNNGRMTISDSTFVANTSINGGGVLNDGRATITGSTFSQSSADMGAGIFNERTLAVRKSTFARNIAHFNGGGIDNGGTVTVLKSTFVGNRSSVYGGAIVSDGRLTLVESTVSRNTSSVYGGGVESAGKLSISRCVFAGNSAQRRGGGIDNFGTLTVINSTFAANGSELGVGGIFNGAQKLTVTSSTFAGNRGGGIFNIHAPPASVKSTILVNSIGGNCAETIDAGYNIADDFICAFNAHGSQVRSDPKLDPRGLQNNGGPTETIALESGSPAINAIPLAECSDQGSPPRRITTDQRGFHRPGHRRAACDVGAYEFQR